MTVLPRGRFGFKFPEIEPEARSPRGFAADRACETKPPFDNRLEASGWYLSSCPRLRFEEKISLRRNHSTEQIFRLGRVACPPLFRKGSILRKTVLLTNERELWRNSGGQATLPNLKICSVE